MSKKKTAGQAKLPTGTRRKYGVVERAAGADLKLLRDLEVSPPATTALAAAYRTLARELDRAEAEKDRYGKINTARELRNVRTQLGNTGPTISDDQYEQLRHDLSAQVRDNPPT